MGERVRWWPGGATTYNVQADAAPTTRRQKAALYGIQRALRGADCACYLTGRYDEPMRRAVAFFQGSRTDGRLAETGVFDELTARELFSRLATFFENAYDLPGPLLRGYCEHEGVWDNGALGPNLNDTGLVQINLGVHRATSQMQACDPLYAIGWCVSHLVERYRTFNNWRAAIVGHRSPLWATYEASGQYPNAELAAEAGKYIDNINSGG